MSVRRLAPPEQQPASFAFTAENLAWAKQQITKYPEGRQASAVIPLLWRAQEQAGGWTSRKAIEYVADLLGMAHIRVLEVATFYTMFLLQPVGRKAHVQWCGTTPCLLRGGEEIKKVCEHRIHHEPFHVSADGDFSWEEVECLGACVNAPMVLIGQDTYEDLTAESFGKVLDALTRGETPKCGPQNGRQFSAPLGGETSLTDLAVLFPPPLAPVVAEPAAVVELHPVAAVEPHPVAAVEPHPVAAVEPHPVAAVEPHPVAAVEPHPVAAVEPHPVAAVEPHPVAAVEPHPVAAVEPHPVAAVEPHPVAVGEPHPVAAVEPHSVAVVEPHPVAVTEPHSAATVDAAPPAIVEPPPAAIRDPLPVELAAIGEDAEVAEKLAALPKDATAEDRANAVGTRPAGLAAPREDKRDNLQRIKGIGRVNEQKLNELGIFHFDQIAGWTPEEIRWVGIYLAFPGRIDREKWVEQAANLAAGLDNPLKPVKA